MSYNPGLPLVDTDAAAQIRREKGLNWFDPIPADASATLWGARDEQRQFIAEFLKRHRGALAGAAVLEPGCGDGLWTSWLWKLGASRIDAADSEDRNEFRLVARAFGLPAVYYPNTWPLCLPRVLRQRYDTVCSLGLLDRDHDPFVSLAMYRRYLAPGGRLIMETGAIDDLAPYLHFTGSGEIHDKECGRQLVPTLGFLRSALNELGMTIDDEAFLGQDLRDRLGRPVGRLMLMARKIQASQVCFYHALVEALGMSGQPFADEVRWEFIGKAQGSFQQNCVVLVSDPKPWTYCAQVEIEIPIGLGPWNITVPIEVLAGTMGIGWVSKDGTAWVARTSAGPAPSATVAHLVIDAEAREGRLVFENWTEEGHPAVAVVQQPRVLKSVTPAEQ